MRGVGSVTALSFITCTAAECSEHGRDAVRDGRGVGRESEEVARAAAGEPAEAEIPDAGDDCGGTVAAGATGGVEQWRGKPGEGAGLVCRTKPVGRGDSATTGVSSRTGAQAASRSSRCTTSAAVR
jgi:hypothetical protein